MMMPRLEDIGRLVGDRSRAAMLSALMDGRAWTGRELAACAYVTAPTASAHLQRLVHGGLISVFAQGRRRYYRIASHQVASALESLLLLAPASMPRHITQRRIAADLAAARLCYDHLAGKLGVALADALVAMGALAFVGSTASLTSDGIALLQRLGIAIASESSRKALCRPCIDWSERRPHIAGMVGGALASDVDIFLDAEHIDDVRPHSDHHPGLEVIDATGLSVAPGFIDAHSHADNAPFLDQDDTSKILQGVTTEVVGNCGFSLAPVNPKYRNEHLGRVAMWRHDFSGTTFADFLADTDKRGYVTNYVPLAGHGTLRVASMGM